MPASKNFLPNTNAVPVDVDAYLRDRGDHPDGDDREGSHVYCNATGSDLGPLSDIDKHWESGEEIVEVDVGARFWYRGDMVDIMLPSERAARTYTGEQFETAIPLGRG